MKTILAPNKRARALTRTEVLIVVAVVGVLVALFSPALARSKARCSRITCVNNLMQTSLSFRVWAGEHNDKFPMQVSVTSGGTTGLVQSEVVFRHFQVMSNELCTPKILICPADSERTPATNFGSGFSDSNVSYFVSLDASDTFPAMFLSGDRNLEIGGVAVKPGIVSIATNNIVGWTRALHNQQGNVALADCSVQSLNSELLSRAVQAAGGPINRLAIPERSADWQSATRQTKPSALLQCAGISRDFA
jgi:competence protein ComGC